MVGDMWHYGHVNFCKQARAMGDYLIVGICKDEDVVGYKRVPILKGMFRLVLLLLRSSFNGSCSR